MRTIFTTRGGTRTFGRALRLLALATLAVTLAACGGGSTKDETKTSSTSGSAPAPAAAPASGTLTIAVQPSASPQTLSADAKQLETYLSTKMGRKVDLVFPTTYAGVIEALRFGHAQAAFMSAWPLALAQKHAGAEIVLAEVREVVIGEQKQEQPYYFSYWVVRKDSPYTTLEQLKGKKVAFPSPLSTSGYVAPLARLVELKHVTTEPKKEADPKKFFGEVLFAGGYAQGYEALKSGQVDATIIAGDVSEALYREVLANTRVVEQQGPIPSHGVAYAKQLDAPTRAKLTETLMSLNAPENRDLMRKFMSGIFVSFKPTTGEEHLASLNKQLDATQLEFVERLR